MRSGQVLVPPTVTPPPEPLPLYKYLPRFIRNPLLGVPEGAYRDRIVPFQPRPNIKMAWVVAPDLVEDVLLKRHELFAKTDVERRVLGGTLGDGVLTANGAHWRWQRRAMAPLFRHQEILSYVPAMAEEAERLTARWRTANDARVRQIDTDMVDVTFDVIARTMLAGGAPAEAELIKRDGSLYLSRSSWELAAGLLRLPTWFPHPGTWTMRRASRRLRAAVGAIIARRRVDGGEGDDLLGRLLSARHPETGEGMTDEQLINNLLTLLEAGHETTARALSWTLYLLARAPEWQARVREEVALVAGSRTITAGDVERLVTTERVIKEAMRLYPPAPVIVRTPTKAVQIEGEWYGPGSHIVIPIFAIHRHRAIWPEPDRFDPDRFLPEAEKAMARTQYMPFGAGARVCLGMSFAMAEAVVLLATFVRAAQFEWDGRHLPEPVSRVTLRPKGGMPLAIRMI